jgi:hypothetical protein
MVGDGGALLQGDEHIGGAGHHHLVMQGLEEFPGALGDIESEVFFVAVSGRRAVIVAAVAGIEDDGGDGLESANQFRAQPGLDDLAQVKARDEDLIALLTDWKGEPLFDAIDPGLARARGDFQLHDAGIQGDGFHVGIGDVPEGEAEFRGHAGARAGGGRRGAGCCRRRVGGVDGRRLREAVERGDLVERDVVAPFESVDRPARER